MKTIIKKITQSPKQFLQKKVEISGWVRTIRSSSNVGFISINDGSCFSSLQVVFTPKMKNFAKISKVSIGSALKIVGTVIESEGSGQSLEIQAEEIKILSLSDSDFPLQKKRHTFEFLRDIAHLRPRSNTFSAVFRLRSVLSFAVHKFFQEQNFVHIHTPIISTSDCEGAGEVFKVTSMDLSSINKNNKKEVDFSRDFFGQATGLTVSGQLNSEALIHSHRNVYTFGPTFRAENSHTSRHASEFWMVEPEMAFCDLEGNMDLAEKFFKYLITYARRELPEEMDFFNKYICKDLFKKIDKAQKAVFSRLDYSNAIEILQKSKQKFEFEVSFGIDLQAEHEKYLCQYFGGPLFIINYPKNIKAFYMKVNDDNKTVRAMDMIVPGVGEIIGGSERETSVEQLRQRMKDLSLNPEDYSWYLDLRRFGGVVHSGFGMGFERMLMYLSGMENIRDVILFPRVPNNAKF